MTSDHLLKFVPQKRTIAQFQAHYELPDIEFKTHCIEDIDKNEKLVAMGKKRRSVTVTVSFLKMFYFRSWTNFFSPHFSGQSSA